MSGIVFTIAGSLRECPSAWWSRLVGPKPENLWGGCDGCTSSPDYWMGYAVWPACVIHDWHYCDEGPDIPRILADLIFRINIWRVLRAQGCPRYRSAYVALAYWSAVAASGRRYFKRSKHA